MFKQCRPCLDSLDGSYMRNGKWENENDVYCSFKRLPLYELQHLLIRAMPYLSQWFKNWNTRECVFMELCCSTIQLCKHDVTYIHFEYIDVVVFSSAACGISHVIVKYHFHTSIWWRLYHVKSSYFKQHCV